MKLLSLFVSAAVAASAVADTLHYDNTYDDPSQSTNIVTCSNGPNGLAGRFPTFGSFPSFPNIGAFGAVTEFGSPACGTCWEIIYTNPSGVASAPLYATAIDHAGAGLINLSQEAMDTLTDGEAVFLGSVQVTSVQVDASFCGL